MADYLPAGSTVLQTPLQPSSATITHYSPSWSGSFNEEIRTLLRSRLTIVCIAMLLIYTLFVLSTLLGEQKATTLGSRPIVETPFQFTMLGFSLFALIWLRRNANQSLQELRLCETIIFCLIGANLATLRYFAYIDFPGPAADASSTQLLIERTTVISNLPWFVTIVYYGVLIPNTRRRGLIMVCTIAAMPLITTLPAGMANEALRPHLGFVLSVTAMGMLMFGIAAVFSAARINGLQRRAFDAIREAKELGAYTLQKKLSEGGMGEVWLAEHRLLKRPCAIKFVRSELSSDSSALARFEREVQAVITLTHFNTVRIYDFGRSDAGNFYYVMEYLEGPTLDSLVREHGPLSPGRVIFLARQLCGALSEAHACGLVHRDVKPGNIIIATLGGQRDIAKLLDFGLVQDYSQVTSNRITLEGTVLGTPAYMCPEQAAGEPVDQRGDIYSLGAVLFYALTGRPPFEATTVGKLLSAHLTQPPPDLNQLSTDVHVDLATVVAKCLAKVPAERFQTTLELEVALANCECAANWNLAEAEAWWRTKSNNPIRVHSIETVAHNSAELQHKG